jgi:hypothetical protein
VVIFLLTYCGESSLPKTQGEKTCSNLKEEGTVRIGYRGDGVVSGRPY